MIRPKAKHLLYVLAGLFAVLLIFLGLAVFMVMRGPVGIGFAKPTVQNVFADAFAPLSIEFRDPTLVWVGEERAFRLQMRRVEIYDDEDALVAEVPRAELGISLDALLHGMVALSRIEFSGATALVIRREDGGFQLGLSTNTATAGNGDSDEPSTLGIVESILTLLASDPDPSSAAGYLHRFAISESTLRFFDVRSNSFWRAPHSDLAFERSADGIRIDLDADVEVGGRDWDLMLEGVYDPDTERGIVAAEFADLNPSHIAAAVPALSALEGVDIPIRGNATLEITLAGEVLAADTQVIVGSGQFSLPGFFDEPVPVDSAAFNGSFNVKENAALIRRLTYQAGDNRLTLSGAVHMESATDEQWRPTAFDVDLTAEDISIFIPSLQDRPVVYETLTLLGRIDDAARTITIDDLTGLTGEGASVNLTAHISDASGEVEVYADGTAENFEGRSLLAYWPRDRGLGARDWIEEHLFSGVATSAAFHVNAPPGSLASLPIPAEVLDVQFEFEDASAEFVPDLPPITEVHGTGRLSAQQFELNVAGGAVEDITVHSGRMFIETMHIRGSPGVFEMDAEGPVSDVLGLLDMGPFDYPSRYGITSSNIGGHGRGTVMLSMPMLRHPPREAIDFSADAIVTDFSMPELMAGVGLTGGVLDFHIDRDGIRASGDVLLDGVAAQMTWDENFDNEAQPSSYRVQATLSDSDRVRLGADVGSALTGPVAVDVRARGQGRNIRSVAVDADLTAATVIIPRTEWIKPAGEPAMAEMQLTLPEGGGLVMDRIHLTGDRTDIHGSFAIGANRYLQYAELERIRLDDLIDVGLSARREDDGTLLLEVDGERFNAAPFMAEFTRAEDEGPGVPYRVDGYVTELTMLEGVQVNNVALRLANDGQRITSLNLNGTFAAGGSVQSAMGPSGENMRSFQVISDNAGELMRGLVGFDDVAGGNLVLDVSIEDIPVLAAQDDAPANVIEGEGETEEVENLAAPDGELAPPPAPLNEVESSTTGRLSIDNFRVVNAPVLAQILSLGSLQGLADTLNGEGITFEELELPFYARGGVLGFESGRAHGSALGLTLDGELNRDEDFANLSGTIVPAYDINSFLGNVPVFGEVFVSREGEGVFAFTYSIIGPADDPQVIVNPLAALTPGLFRRIFSGNPPTPSNTAPPEAVQPETENAAPSEEDAAPEEMEPEEPVTEPIDG